MRIIFVLLLLFSATSAFAQDEGKLVRAFDEEKVDDLINTVKNMAKFKNYVYDENSVILWAEELFRQYFKDKDAQVPFTEADYQAAVAEKQILMNTIARLRNDSTACVADKAAMQAQIDAKDKELEGFNNTATLLAESDAHMNELVAVINRLRNDSTSLANEKAVLQTQIEDKNKALEGANNNATLLAECDAQKKALMETITRLKNDSTSLVNNKISMQSQLEANNSQITLLSGQLQEAERKYQAYEAAFKEIKDVIDKGYNNKVLPIRSMKEDELNAAINKFEATEDLLKTNKVLYSDMKNKVDEMRSWIGLKKTLDDAVAYMAGKYSDGERIRLLKEIDNKFKGIKTLTKEQTDEKDAIRKALEDQSSIHDNFMSIINASRKKKALSTKEVIDEIMNGLNVYDEGARLSGRLSDYHVSYRTAFNDFMKELKKGEDNPKINGPEELSKYLDHLVEMF